MADTAVRPAVGPIRRGHGMAELRPVRDHAPATPYCGRLLASELASPTPHRTQAQPSGHSTDRGPPYSPCHSGLTACTKSRLAPLDALAFRAMLVALPSI